MWSYGVYMESIGEGKVHTFTSMRIPEPGKSVPGKGFWLQFLSFLLELEDGIIVVKDLEDSTSCNSQQNCKA
jgi:uncharacterized OB-fold protein